jgi:hypothetical protein
MSAFLFPCLERLADARRHGCQDSQRGAPFEILERCGVVGLGDELGWDGMGKLSGCFGERPG